MNGRTSIHPSLQKALSLALELQQRMQNLELNAKVIERGATGDDNVPMEEVRGDVHIYETFLPLGQWDGETIPLAGEVFQPSTICGHPLEGYET